MRLKRYNPATEMFEGDLISFNESNHVWYLVVELTQCLRPVNKYVANTTYGCKTQYTKVRCLHVDKQQFFEFECDKGGTFELMLVRPT